MDTLSIIFGIVGIISFIFSLYTYFITESKKVIQASNRAMQLERIRNSKHTLLGILNNVDAIVQIPKKGNVTIAQLQDLARVARSQIVVLAKQLEVEEKQMEGWRFGKLLESVQDIKVEKDLNG